MSVCEYYNKEVILHLKNAISEEDCKYLVHIIDKYKENGKRVVHSEDNNIKSYVFDPISIEDRNVASECCEIITKTFKNILLTLPEPLIHLRKSSYVHHVELRKIWGETREHIDGAFHDQNEPDPEHMRVLSVIIALNSDYDGGELCFPDQEIKIKLKAGEVLLFPPYWTHPHYSNELKNDTYRYTITTWFSR